MREDTYAAQREARYREAIYGQPVARILGSDGVVPSDVRAVIAVADQEHAELSAEVVRLRLSMALCSGTCRPEVASDE